MKKRIATQNKFNFLKPILDLVRGLKSIAPVAFFNSQIYSNAVVQLKAGISAPDSESDPSLSKNLVSVVKTFTNLFKKPTPKYQLKKIIIQLKPLIEQLINFQPVQRDLSKALTDIWDTLEGNDVKHQFATVFTTLLTDSNDDSEALIEKMHDWKLQISQPELSGVDVRPNYSVYINDALEVVAEQLVNGDSVLLVGPGISKNGKQSHEVDLLIKSVLAKRSSRKSNREFVSKTWGTLDIVDISSSVIDGLNNKANVSRSGNWISTYQADAVGFLHNPPSGYRALVALNSFPHSASFSEMTLGYMLQGFCLKNDRPITMILDETTVNHLILPKDFQFTPNQDMVGGNKTERNRTYHYIAIRLNAFDEGYENVYKVDVFTNEEKWKAQMLVNSMMADDMKKT